MNKYLKWFFVVIFITAVLSGFILFRYRSNPAYDTINEQLVLRLAETYPADHPSAMAAQKFAELAYERTDGRINIKVYYNGKLGNESEVLKQMQFGGIAMARVNFLELSNIVTYLQEYIEPYSYKSPEEFLDALDDDKDNISLKMQLEKFIPLVYYYPDHRCFYNNKSAIKGADDFTGLKLNTSTSGKITDIVKTLGCEPVNISTDNIFKSLTAGYMDGGETTFCEFALSDYASVVPYVSLSDYLYCPDIIIASSVSLRDISRADQQLLEECAKDSFVYQKQLLLQLQQDSLSELENKSIVIQNKSLLEPILKKIFLKAGGNKND